MSKDLKTSARRWAWEYMLCNAELPEHAQDDEYRAAQHILATTTPLTMADVKWDNRHFGRVCEGEDGVEWVMLYRRGDGRIMGVTPDLQKVRGLRPQWLTPNGKRYELREVTVSSNENVGSDQAEHPETLRTKDDYENAPRGTIVARNEYSPHMKHVQNVWGNAFNDTYSDERLAGTSRKVLRWGWGE